MYVGDSKRTLNETFKVVIRVLYFVENSGSGVTVYAAQSATTPYCFPMCAETNKLFNFTVGMVGDKLNMQCMSCTMHTHSITASS